MPAGAQQRQSLASPAWAEGSANLNAYRRGVRVMMARNSAGRSTADFRRSWQFWANVHGHYGTACAGPLPAGLTGVRAWEHTTPAEGDTWCTCVHDALGFLPWHRAALYYFERTVAQAAGVPGLRIPYWDVTANPQLPAQFRRRTYVDEAGVTRPNPLYTAQRAAALNAGTAQIAASVRSPADAMRATTFSALSTRLEATPHGGVHVALGGGVGYMRSVATAGMDPIFWSHHANMDRLYRCWTTARGILPPADVRDDVFRFVNEAGARVTGPVTAAMNVAYAGGSSCPAAAPAGAVSMAEPANIRLQIEAAAPHGGTGLFDVWLLAGGREAFAGTVNFFGAEHHGERVFDLDIQAALRVLGVPVSGVTVDMRPSTGLEAVR